jgi:hypothetical protein
MICASSSSDCDDDASAGGDDDIDSNEEAEAEEEEVEVSVARRAAAAFSVVISARTISIHSLASTSGVFLRLCALCWFDADPPWL